MVVEIDIPTGVNETVVERDAASYEATEGAKSKRSISKPTTLINLSESDESLEPLLTMLDFDGNGKISLEEVGFMIRIFQLYKKGVQVLVCLLILSLAGVLGLTILANELYKDTETSGSTLIVSGESTVVQTSTAKNTDIDFKFAALLDDSHLERIETVTFPIDNELTTIDGVTIASDSNLHMKIIKYVKVDKTWIRFYGANNEFITVDKGVVTINDDSFAESFNVCGSITCSSISITTDDEDYLMIITEEAESLGYRRNLRTGLCETSTTPMTKGDIFGQSRKSCPDNCTECDWEHNCNKCETGYAVVESEYDYYSHAMVRESFFGGKSSRCEADADSDGVADDKDNCVDVANPDQSDVNENGIGDACDVCAAITTVHGLCVVCEGTHCSDVTCDFGYYKDGVIFPPAFSNPVCKDCSADVDIDNGNCEACTDDTTCTSATCDTGYFLNRRDVSCRECVNDDSVTDHFGNTCSSSYDLNYGWQCGSADTDDFTAREKCCECGRGCPTHCVNCVDSGTVVKCKVCEHGYGVDSFDLCHTCSNHCKVCDLDSTKCTECEHGYTTVELGDGSIECQPCNQDSCQVCVGLGEYDCQRCKPDYFLVDVTGLQQLAGWFDYGTCTACLPYGVDCEYENDLCCAAGMNGKGRFAYCGRDAFNKNWCGAQGWEGKYHVYHSA